MGLCNSVGVTTQFGFFITDDLSFAMKKGYVGFSPSLATIIVAHQGTDTSRMSV